ncbi:MAG: hypothetical protein QXE01_02650 [Sulfolobales archaeon]
MLLALFSILVGFSSYIGSPRKSSDSYESVGLRVSYPTTQALQSPGSEPEFLVIIKDRSGRPLKAVLSIYAWDPGGSFRNLGVFGGVGVVRANYSALWDFAKMWRDALVSRNTDPKHISPGILIAGAIHERDGVYYSFKGVPVRIADIIGNRSAIIEIIEDLSVKRPLERPNQTAPSRAEDTDYNIKRSKNMETLTWPPSEITEACYPVGDGVGCFVWELEETYAAGSQGVPIVVSYVYGSHVDKLDSVLLRLYYQTTDTIKLVFSIAASVGKGNVSFSYEIIGYSHELRGNVIWLDQYKYFNYGYDFWGNSILGMGFQGDMAVARYKLYYWYCSIGCTKYTMDDVANMTMMRPVVSNNQMIPWWDIDMSPSDGQGLLEKVFWTIKGSWNWSKDYMSQMGILIDQFKVMDEIATLPAFSASGAVAAILCWLFGGVVCTIALTTASIVSATVGLEQQLTTYTAEYIGIKLKSSYVNQGYCIWANYFYSPQKLQYGGGSYSIGSLYVDALIYYNTGCPQG